MTLIATPGASNANSYITVADADTFFTTRPFSDDWVALTTPEKESMLIDSTSKLDWYDYVGQTVTDTQALKWPRQLNDAGDLIRNYAINAIPLVVQKATCVNALYLAQTGGTVPVAPGTIESVKVMELSLTYASTAQDINPAVDFTGLPMEAARYLSGLRLITVTG